MRKRNKSIKKEPTNYKYNLMKAEKTCTLLFVIFMGCHSSHSLTKKVDGFKCEILDLKKKSECEVLHILNDTVNWKNGSLEVGCVNSAVFDVFKRANMVPYRHCDFGGCGYYNYSLNKSIFLIDLFRLMVFYKCADTTILKSNIKGNFTEVELETIKQSHYGGNPIDTSILLKRF